MGEKELPPFASGKITSDYSILFEYWRVAREKGREDLVESGMLSEDDYRMLVEEAAKNPRLEDLLDALVERLLDRIDPGVAVEAVQRATGARVDADTARRLVARLLASWLVEAGEYWNMVKLRREEEQSGEDGEQA